MSYNVDNLFNDDENDHYGGNYYGDDEFNSSTNFHDNIRINRRKQVKNTQIKYPDAPTSSNQIKIDNTETKTETKTSEKMIMPLPKVEKVEPLNSSATQMKWINKEKNYIPRKKVRTGGPLYKSKSKSRTIKKCVNLTWYHTGFNLEKKYKTIDVRNLFTCIPKINEKVKFCVRDIIPITAMTTMKGRKACIYCKSHPNYNNYPDNDEKTFISINPGGHTQTYEYKKRQDVIKAGPNKLFNYILQYIDDDDEKKEYMYAMERDKYDSYIKDNLDKIKKHYKKYPKTGDEYIKEIVTLATRIGKNTIEEMGTNEWIERNARSAMGDKNNYIITLKNGQSSTYGRLVSMYPKFKGDKRYFNTGPKMDSYLPLKMHYKILRILKRFKQMRGEYYMIKFEMKSKGFPVNEHDPIIRRMMKVPMVTSMKVIVVIGVGVGE